MILMTWETTVLLMLPGCSIFKCSVNSRHFPSCFSNELLPLMTHYLQYVEVQSIIVHLQWHAYLFFIYMSMLFQYFTKCGNKTAAKKSTKKTRLELSSDFSVIVGLTVFLPVVRSVSRSFAPSICVFLSFISFMLSPLPVCVCVCEIYGWIETSHHTAPHNRQCLTSLQPKKHPETSQQCINGTAFTTVWPAVTSVPNTHTERVYYRGMWWVSVGCLVRAVFGDAL